MASPTLTLNHFSCNGTITLSLGFSSWQVSQPPLRISVSGEICGPATHLGTVWRGLEITVCGQHTARCLSGWTRGLWHAGYFAAFSIELGSHCFHASFLPHCSITSQEIRPLLRFCLHQWKACTVFDELQFVLKSFPSWIIWMFRDCGLCSSSWLLTPVQKDKVKNPQETPIRSSCSQYWWFFSPPSHFPQAATLSHKHRILSIILVRTWLSEGLSQNRRWPSSYPREGVILSRLSYPNCAHKGCLQLQYPYELAAETPSLGSSENLNQGFLNGLL